MMILQKMPLLNKNILQSLRVEMNGVMMCTREVNSPRWLKPTRMNILMTVWPMETIYCTKQTSNSTSIKFKVCFKGLVVVSMLHTIVAIDFMIWWIRWHQRSMEYRLMIDMCSSSKSGLQHIIVYWLKTIVKQWHLPVRFTPSYRTATLAKRCWRKSTWRKVTTITIWNKRQIS